MFGNDGSKKEKSKEEVFRWINEKGHTQGIFWTVCASFFSNLCDTSIRLVGDILPTLQITFFRLFFGTMLLLPFLLYHGKGSFAVKNKIGHLLRIVIGFGAMVCWIYGASQTTLPSITTLSFVCPLFVLPLAYLFLGEKSDRKRIALVGVGFIGVVVIALFEKGDIITGANIVFFQISHFSPNFHFFHLFHPGVVFLFIGAILFAMSDILNKKLLDSENLFSLLFYFYFGTALISFIPAMLVWQQMGFKETAYLLLQGAGGIAILYCILKAASATEISSIAPYKYIELLFSIILGYVLFHEMIRLSTIIGAGLIIPSVLFIAYNEINKDKAAFQEKRINETT